MGGGGGGWSVKVRLCLVFKGDYRFMRFKFKGFGPRELQSLFRTNTGLRTPKATDTNIRFPRGSAKVQLMAYGPEGLSLNTTPAGRRDA